MNKLTFKTVVALTSIFIASCAAYFSIIGIAMLFSGSKVAAAIMASSLELGKLVSTSFLFKYWKYSKSFLKIYLTVSVLVLMFITSIGVFGYLTASYQKSSLDNKLSTEKITILEQKREEVNKKIDLSKSRIVSLNELRASQENRLNQSITNPVIVRNPIQLQEIQSQTADLITKSESNVSEENKKIESSYQEIDIINKNISDLKIESMGKNDIITFKFVSDETGLPMDTVVKWFITLIISVFDPLAICLLLAYNTAEEEILEKKS